MDKTKTKKEINNATKSKTFSNLKLLYFVIFLLVIGFIILSASGSFNTPKLSANFNAESNMGNNNPHGSANMEALKQIKDLETHVNSNPTDYNAILQLGHLLNDNGFYEKAIKRYNQYLSANPNEADVWVDLGVCYFNLNNLDNAIVNMEKGLKIDPNHQIACLNLGIVNFSAGNKEKANSYWEKAISINPNNEIGIKAKQLLNSK